MDEIIAKVNIHSSQADCAKAIKEASASNALSTNNGVENATANASTKKKAGKAHTLYKNKSFPTHLFCERAVDPNRELFWRIDWSKLVEKGTKGAGWDLKDDSSDVATSQGQGVKDLVEEVQRDSNTSSSNAEASSSTTLPSSLATHQEKRRYTFNHRLSFQTISRALHGTPSSAVDIDLDAPKRRPGRPRKEDSLSAGVTPAKRKYNRKKSNTNGGGFSSDSDLASDDSFQSGDEFEVEDNLLVKARHLDTPESSDNEGSQFSAHPATTMMKTTMTMTLGRPLTSLRASEQRCPKMHP